MGIFGINGVEKQKMKDRETLYVLCMVHEYEILQHIPNDGMIGNFEGIVMHIWS
jgi:hypothetical protein